MKSSGYALTNEQWRGIAIGLMAIADKRDLYARSMIDKGFMAFAPHHQLMESFAENDEQIAIHRRCEFESMKERFSTPEPRMGSQPYWSPFLEEMRAQRDKNNGMSLSEVKSTLPLSEYLWRQHYDPCVQGFERACWKDPSIRESKAVWSAVNARFAQEAKEKTTELTRARNFAERDQRSTFAALMQRYAGGLGFTADLKMSSARAPVFVKALKGDWSLMFVMRYHRYFFWDAPSWTFPLELILAKRGKRKFKELQLGDGVTIDYPMAMDQFFATCYKLFSTPEEMELTVRARLAGW